MDATSLAWSLSKSGMGFQPRLFSTSPCTGIHDTDYDGVTTSGMKIDVLT